MISAETLPIEKAVKPYTAEVRMENSNPVLYVNDEKCSPIIYALSDIPASSPLTAQAQKNIANFAAQGIHIVCTDVNLYKGWKKNGAYNADFLISDLNAILETNPKAAIMLRLHVNPPYWWMRDNPDELCEFGAGDVPYVDQGEYERLIDGDEGNAMRVSLSSEKWKKDAAEKICELIEQIVDTPQGQHVIAIQTACGIYGEWHQWGLGYHPDYGKSMTAYFQTYLIEKYGTEISLRKAWRNDGVSFDTAIPAPPYMRYHEGIKPLRDPALDRYVIDSLTALMRSVTDAIIYFSKIIKDKWKRKILIGTFYGYYDSWDQIYVGGHLDVEHLTKSGVVDYFSGPFHYGEVIRGIHGVTSARSLLESHRLNGILWLTEMDNPPIGSSTAIGGDPERMQENIAIMRRNVLEPITRGMGMWFYDHRLVLELGAKCSIYNKKGWWDHPALLKEIRMLKLLGQWCIRKKYKPSADVLLVFDAESRYYSNAHDAFSGMNAFELYMALGKSGVMYDSIYLHDIEKADIERYHCVIFVHAMYLPEKKRRIIREKLYKNGKHIVWINANGFLNENCGDVDLISAISEIKVQYSNADGIIKCQAPLPQVEINSPVPYSMKFSVSDKEAKPVAVFPDTGEIAGAKKEFPQYTQWYFSTFPADWSVLREIFRMAGAHIYSEKGETLLAGNGLIVITVDKESDVCLHLRNGLQIKEKLPGMTTAVYDAENGERLDMNIMDEIPNLESIDIRVL